MGENENGETSAVDKVEKVKADPLSAEVKAKVLADYATVSTSISQILDGSANNLAVDVASYLTPTTKGDPLPLDTKHAYGQIEDMPTLIYFKRIRAALEHALVHNWIPNDLEPPSAGEEISNLVKAPAGRGPGEGPRRNNGRGRRGGRGFRGRFRRGFRGGRGRGRGGRGKKENDNEEGEQP